jgi:hypothetical protein
MEMLMGLGAELPAAGTLTAPALMVR